MNYYNILYAIIKSQDEEKGGPYVTEPTKKEFLEPADTPAIPAPGLGRPGHLPLYEKG
jgi:hypothetical protein